MKGRMILFCMVAFLLGAFVQRRSGPLIPGAVGIVLVTLVAVKAHAYYREHQRKAAMERLRKDWEDPEKNQLN